MVSHRPLPGHDHPPAIRTEAAHPLRSLLRLHALPRHQRFARDGLSLATGTAAAAIRARVRAAQSAPRAHALVSHPGGIPHRPHPLDKPLNGLRVAIDPGHIGGPWAQMEERSTRYHGSAPVQEGDLNLITARLLKQELTDDGRQRFCRARLDRAGHPLPSRRHAAGSRELLIAHSSHARTCTRCRRTSSISSSAIG